MLIIRHDEVREILTGAEGAVLDLVRRTYRRHDEGATTVPHSTFLRFPGDRANRIIGLPAYLGGDRPAAGIKWVASFPANLATGLARASATIVLNSMETGRPEAFLEGARISAARTAASAAVAAGTLLGGARPTGVSMIGCGLINFETLRFLAASLPAIPEVTIHDSSPARAGEFADRAAALLPDARLTITAAASEAVAAHELVSIATTAVEPHLTLAGVRPGAVVLHISLRDIVPETILAARNVVDDVDHAVRERTSLHLAELRTGGRDFVHATLGGLLRGTATLPGGQDGPVIFSPFGLGVLDIALARYVADEARERGLGVPVEDFLPQPEPVHA
ncbi:2,3-diaminopropionate biosynthesis protein SbnB [Nonomuraea sp. FMUSA5-5]|uniref:2,3-diaminopropionate biosynthesis protein SbnB n=1 Tax=Nonomuraea composti TaxID=2720023 RepID=A0ABX1BF37_9ACTN|nr:2,3-diaminopropionate biosynthesis protein SbnB [Nonomuraea sp. FMUSA5-5]